MFVYGKDIVSSMTMINVAGTYFTFYTYKRQAIPYMPCSDHQVVLSCLSYLMSSTVGGGSVSLPTFLTLKLPNSGNQLDC